MEDMEKIYTIMINLDSLAGRLATPFLSKDPKKLKSPRSRLPRDDPDS